MINKLFLKQSFKRKCICVIIGLFCPILFLSWTHSSNARKCFIDRSREDEKHLKLPDILKAGKKPIPGKSIFFHETSCPPSAQIELSTREACAIESAALANPSSEIFVLFASPRILNSSVQHIINAILSYPNVNLRNLNLWTYAAQTPIYEWLNDEKLFQSKYVLSHTSDFLRYLTLWKFGGTYLDLDVIVKQNLESIAPNYAGAESDRFVAAGIINLDHDGFGHEIADLCLRNFQVNFDGSEWGNNGPGVITRVLQDVCKTKSPSLMTRERCFGFKVFPKEYFYVVRWWNWHQFFQHKHLEEVLKLTNKSIVVHVWNKNSNKEIIVKDAPPVAYAVLAEKYCPKVFKTSGNFL